MPPAEWYNLKIIGLITIFIAVPYISFFNIQPVPANY